MLSDKEFEEWSMADCEFTAKLLSVIIKDDLHYRNKHEQNMSVLSASLKVIFFSVT